MTFNEYLLSWYHHFVDDHMDDDDWCARMYKIMSNDQSLVSECNPPYCLLNDIDDEESIWDCLFDSDVIIDDLPDTESFLVDAFSLLGEKWINKYDFARDFMDSFAHDIAENTYSMPDRWFRNICDSYSYYEVQKFKDNSYDFYLQHMDSLERYKEDREIESGDVMRNAHHWPHCLFVCGTCYRDLATQFAKKLWPDEF